MDIKKFIEEIKDEDPKLIQEKLRNCTKDEVITIEIETNNELDYWNITNAIKLLKFKNDLHLTLKFIDETIDKVNDPYWLGYITKRLNNAVEIIKDSDTYKF